MAEKRGRPSLVEERAIREKLQKFLPDILKFYGEVFKSNNKTLKAKIAEEILKKLVSDRKAMELAGQDGGPITIKLINDYLSTTGVIVSPSKRSSVGQDKVQDFGVAQESKKNVNSPGKDSVGST